MRRVSQSQNNNQRSCYSNVCRAIQHLKQLWKVQLPHGFLKRTSSSSNMVTSATSVEETLQALRFLKREKPPATEAQLNSTRGRRNMVRLHHENQFYLSHENLFLCVFVFGGTISGCFPIFHELSKCATQFVTRNITADSLVFMTFLLLGQLTTAQTCYQDLLNSLPLFIKPFQ